MHNTQDKILLLGGSYAQIPAIKAANERGLHTILCDYLPDNPGQKFAAEYINASTTDKKRILEIARERRVDYVWAYASDPAAPTAAYVSEKLGLPGNSYESVITLSEKHLFRQLQKESGLNYPASLSFTKSEISEDRLEMNLEYPLIVKPVDSSGSKGVVLINNPSEFKKAANYASSFSRSDRIIVEEYVDAEGPQLHGDGFVVNGTLIFCYLGDHFYNDEVNPFVPYSTVWPSEKSETDLNRVYKVISHLIECSGFKNGSINIEVRFAKDDEIYIMEMGPRSGGNFVPKLLEYATGFDAIEAGLNIATGKQVLKPEIKKEFAAYYVIHSKHNGYLKNITISENLTAHIKEQHQYVNIGGEVHSFQGSNAAIGILLMTFPDKETMDDVMGKMDQYINIEVEQDAK